MSVDGKPKIKLSELTDLYDIEDDSDKLIDNKLHDLKEEDKDWQETNMKNADIEMEEEFW